MEPKVFNQLVKITFKDATDTLTAKGITYSVKGDRLSNFKQAGHLSRCSPICSLKGMVDKHIVALSDFIYDYERGMTASPEEWKEKTGDIINYMMLLRALLTEEGLM